MSEIWGTLPKSAIDAETIEEAIDRKIAEHDEDPEAHLAAGGSLSEHKTDETIDHPEGSIPGDKIEEGAEVHVSGSFDRQDFHWFCLFESLSGFGQGSYAGGTITLNVTDVQLSTAATNYSNAYIWKNIDISNVFTWDRRRKLKTRVYLSANVAQLLYFALGNTQNIYLTKYVGFKINNGDIYAGVCNGSAETLEDTGVNVSAGGSYDFTIDFFPGEKVDFYINDTLVATIDTGLPSGETDAKMIFSAFCMTTENVAKTFKFSYLDFWQDIP